MDLSLIGVSDRYNSILIMILLWRDCLESCHICLSMDRLNKWYIDDQVFRSFSHEARQGTLSAGFMNKVGWVEDVVNEDYNRFAMVYLLRGRGRYSDSDGESYELTAGDVFLRCPNRIHTNTVDPESQWQELFVSVRAKWFPFLVEQGMLDSKQASFRVGHSPEIAQTVYNLMLRLKEAESVEELGRIELAMVDVVLRAVEKARQAERGLQPHAEILEVARRRIVDRASESIGLEDLLSGLGLSYARLRILFKEAYCMTPGDLRIQTRMDRACEMLLCSACSVSEVAHALGYTDAFIFSKQFSQRMGVAPSKFRG